MNYDAIYPTCTTEGKTEGWHCVVCNKVTKEQEIVPATGHHYTSEVTKAATCQATGIRTYTCEICNDKYTETIAKKSHTAVKDNSVSPTCTTEGKTEGSHCSVCGEVLVAQQVIDKLAAPMIVIRNNPGVATLDYGDSIKLTADVFNMSDGAKIVWYVDGEKAGEGETFTLTKPKNSVTVTVKMVDKNGNVIVINGNEISDTETVKVNNGFFKKLVAFFKNIFGMLKVHTQKIKF